MRNCYLLIYYLFIFIFLFTFAFGSSYLACLARFSLYNLNQHPTWVNTAASIFWVLQYHVSISWVLQHSRISLLSTVILLNQYPEYFDTPASVSWVLQYSHISFLSTAVLLCQSPENMILPHQYPEYCDIHTWVPWVLWYSCISLLSLKYCLVLVVLIWVNGSFTR